VLIFSGGGSNRELTPVIERLDKIERKLDDLERKLGNLERELAQPRAND
jgi:hypothetical protein